MRAYVEQAPWIERGHRPRTVEAIERVVEWVEAQDRPFTTHQAWNGARASYSTATLTLLSLRRAGLVVCVNPGRMPPRYVRYDRAGGRG